uniref:MARVEL domain-containing protein n=1 Tax=Romanomermis culicivorax TaxID=13658 RepID=A0A915IQH6_ROMCU
MTDIIGSLNLEVLKLPLGCIRIVELPMAILAFATTSGYMASGYIKLPFDCKPDKYTVEFGYSFNIGGTELPKDLCNKSSLSEMGNTLFEQGFSSSSQFFVFVGVISFLYVLGILIVYLKYWTNYENDPKFAMIDFTVTGILGVFWFFASCAWASGVSGLKSVTSVDAIEAVMKKTVPCSTKECQLVASWNYASLNVSLITGFACVALWLANLWFIYKETTWSKNRQVQTTVGSVADPASSGISSGQSQPSYR